MGKERIAFVCQRYGLEVNGGSELYCRQIAEKLTAFYEVHVYTTCAMDYSTWANVYQPGDEEINGVLVHRFLADQEREARRFAEISEKVYTDKKRTKEDELTWIKEQGPVCDLLLDELYAHKGEYKAILFMTYLYYLTAMGMLRDFPNAILIPTVHDEPPVYLKHYDKVFLASKAIAWNTYEEKAFAEKRFPGVEKIPSAMTGIGVEAPKGELPEIPEELKKVQYITYAGRIDESKGCGEMFRYFIRYKELCGGDMKLVLMGKPVMEIPDHPDIINLGFVSEEMKFSVMRSALALVLFSHFESLSMVVLESMLMGKPVLVTEKCDVLKGHCVRSNAGLYFNTFAEFVLALEYLRDHPNEYKIMCKNGKKYVQCNYQWDVILQKYCGLIEDVSKTEQ